MAFSRRSEQERKPVQIGLIVNESLDHRLNEALKMLRASLPAAIEIQQHVASTAMMSADPTQIHQVLMNLCTNAAHAMREEGGMLQVGLVDTRIEPEASPRHSGLESGAYVKLTVKDTGNGIDPCIRDRIFVPFFHDHTPSCGRGPYQRTSQNRPESSHRHVHRL